MSLRKYYCRIFGLTIARTDTLMAEQKEIEEEYDELYQARRKDEEKLREIKKENTALKKQINSLSEELAFVKRHSREEKLELITPPRASDVFYRCNTEEWFQRFREDAKTGAIYLSHDRHIYPCDQVIIPRNIRICNMHGDIANLTQPYTYEALSAKKYAQDLIPESYVPYKMRILFGIAEDDGFWLQNPLSAQDVIAEIWTRESDELSIPTAIRDNNMKQWRQESGGLMYGTRNEMIFTLVISIEQLFNRNGPGNISKNQIRKFREQCYAEYLDLYFHDTE